MNKNAFGLPTIGSALPETPASRSQMMNSRKILLNASADPIISKAIQIALEDGNPGQMAAMKMCMDRLLPMQEFEAKKDGSRTAVTITISGVGKTNIGDGKDGGDNVIDAEEV